MVRVETDLSTELAASKPSSIRTDGKVATRLNTAAPSMSRRGAGKRDWLRKLERMYKVTYPTIVRVAVNAMCL